MHRPGYGVLPDFVCRCVTVSTRRTCERVTRMLSGCDVLRVLRRCLVLVGLFDTVRTLVSRTVVVAGFRLPC